MEKNKNCQFWMLSKLHPSKGHCLFYLNGHFTMKSNAVVRHTLQEMKREGKIVVDTPTLIIFKYTKEPGFLIFHKVDYGIPEELIPLLPDELVVELF